VSAQGDAQHGRPTARHAFAQTHAPEIHRINRISQDEQDSQDWRDVFPVDLRIQSCQSCEILLIL
jgi:hypothetical protein